jgi:hypothetical protein
MRMKYIISALLVVLALVSCAGATVTFTGNTITQINHAIADASGSGTINEKEANWAVVCGDGNNLVQDNYQNAIAVTADEKLKATNIALVVGIDNFATQKNDPSSIDVNQTNELLAIGTANTAYQENTADWDVGNVGAVKQNQWNFGVIFGTGNGLNQTNYADGHNTGKRNVTQVEANAAYVYGEMNNVTQNNTLEGYADMCTGMTNQTVKNLAFAITSCPDIQYTPGCEAFSLTPSDPGDSDQTLDCPGIPELPCPPAMTPEFPLDP